MRFLLSIGIVLFCHPAWASVEEVCRGILQEHSEIINAQDRQGLNERCLIDARQVCRNSQSCESNSESASRGLNRLRSNWDSYLNGSYQTYLARRERAGANRSELSLPPKQILTSSPGDDTPEVPYVSRPNVASQAAPVRANAQERRSAREERNARRRQAVVASRTEATQEEDDNSMQERRTGALTQEELAAALGAVDAARSERQRVEALPNCNRYMQIHTGFSDVNFSAVCGELTNVFRRGKAICKDSDSACNTESEVAQYLDRLASREGQHPLDFIHQIDEASRVNGLQDLVDQAIIHDLRAQGKNICEIGQVQASDGTLERVGLRFYRTTREERGLSHGQLPARAPEVVLPINRAQTNSWVGDTTNASYFSRLGRVIKTRTNPGLSANMRCDYIRGAWLKQRDGSRRAYCDYRMNENSAALQLGGALVREASDDTIFNAELGVTTGPNDIRINEFGALRYAMTEAGFCNESDDRKSLAKYCVMTENQLQVCYQRINSAVSSFDMADDVNLNSAETQCRGQAISLPTASLGVICSNIYHYCPQGLSFTPSQSFTESGEYRESLRRFGVGTLQGTALVRACAALSREGRQNPASGSGAQEVR